MSKAGERLLEGMNEALAIAKGEQPAASIHVNGHTYVPKPEWQPIASAPQDGTRVLLWSAKWEASSTGQFYGTDWRLAYELGPFQFPPIHWMPLPPAPTET